MIHTLTVKKTPHRGDCIRGRNCAFTEMERRISKSRLFCGRNDPESPLLMLRNFFTPALVDRVVNVSFQRLASIHKKKLAKLCLAVTIHHSNYLISLLSWNYQPMEPRGYSSRCPYHEIVEARAHHRGFFAILHHLYGLASRWTVEVGVLESKQFPHVFPFYAIS